MKETENKELVAIISRRVRECGKIPFVEFMDLALYHPRQGYYQSAREKIGARGDYYTSPEIHPVFGLLLSLQLDQMWELLGCPSPFQLVEMGAGRGILAKHILNSCQKGFPRFYDALKYVLVEKSRPFVEAQKALLERWAAEGKARWSDSELFFENEDSLTGCILSNELIDSFPVHVVQRQEGKLKEVYVTLSQNEFTEDLGPLSSPYLEEYFQRYGRPLEEGQRAEANLLALEWVEKISRILKRGFILTIDYGYEAEELYHPSRREGTLLCYFRHRVSHNPFEHIGCQDMTSHVNFSALMEKGKALGLQKAGYTEQFKFLVALGLLQELEAWEKTSLQDSAVHFLKEKLAMRNFLIPGGMGSLFKVLIQFKSLSAPALLGFRHPFSPP